MISTIILYKYGIAAAVISISSPGVYFGDPAFSSKLARQCNEFSAKIINNRPGRFGFFATLPYIAWRLSIANTDPKILEKAPRGALAYLKSLYYDTALSTSNYAMGALKELVGPNQILFECDYPYAPDPLVAREISDFRELDSFNDTEREVPT